jgi:hypothetical protein
MEQYALKDVNHCCITNIFFYLETSGGQNYNLYLNVFNFSTPALTRHLWQPKRVVFLQRCLLQAFLLIIKQDCHLVDHHMADYHLFYCHFADCYFADCHLDDYHLAKYVI